MCEWEAWIHRCRHVIYHQYSTCSNEHCKQPKDAGFTPVYAIRYKWKCKRCDPTDPHYLSDLNIMIVGRQVVGLGNGLWNELKVEDGRETWVRYWTREDHSGGAAGGLVGCMDAFWFLKLPGLRWELHLNNRKFFNLMFWMCLEEWYELAGSPCLRVYDLDMWILITE